MNNPGGVQFVPASRRFRDDVALVDDPIRRRYPVLLNKIEPFACRSWIVGPLKGGTHTARLCQGTPDAPGSFGKVKPDERRLPGPVPRILCSLRPVSAPNVELSIAVTGAQSSYGSAHW